MFDDGHIQLEFICVIIQFFTIILLFMLSIIPKIHILQHLTFAKHMSIFKEFVDEKYKWRLRFPVVFLSFWFSCFGILFGVCFWPQWMLREIVYCFYLIGELWKKHSRNMLFSHPSEAKL